MQAHRHRESAARDVIGARRMRRARCLCYCFRLALRPPKRVRASPDATFSARRPAPRPFFADQTGSLRNLSSMQGLARAAQRLWAILTRGHFTRGAVYEIVV